ncbi:MAG: hypothetical protein KDD82_27610 [Planctomycetes bacterium]|nr:hypothetical protein [Planctomycetota bacterium]
MTRRFAIQEHTVGPDDRHYDLMIEDSGVLVTFQLEAPPGEGRVLGRCSFDHRLRYLSYEGELSGGRGTVRLWDHGQATDEQGDPRAARYAARFAGQRLSGRWVLQRERDDAIACQPLEGSA